MVTCRIKLSVLSATLRTASSFTDEEQRLNHALWAPAWRAQLLRSKGEG